MGESERSASFADCFLSFTVPLLPWLGVESDVLLAGTEESVSNGHDG